MGDGASQFKLCASHGLGAGIQKIVVGGYFHNCKSLGLAFSGAFDEAFNPVQYEDIDLCYRARAAGFKLLYEPAVEMYHFENVTTEGSGDLNFKYLTIKNGLLFKRRWQHMFAHEDGPSDASIVWREVPRVSWDAVGQLPMDE